MPVLLPTGHTAVRARIDHWLEREGLRANVVGEFEDSALLAAFGRGGMGAFPASRLSKRELLADPALVLLGESPELVEAFHLISAERKIQHPLVQRMLDGLKDATPG
jgi:LysR family transcriptional activator of nhaA